MSRQEAGAGLAFFLVGAAVGAALGVLFAPRSGRETREKLGDWLKERRDQGSELLSKLKEEIPAKKDQIAAAIKAGKQAYYEAGKANSGEREAVRA